MKPIFKSKNKQPLTIVKPKAKILNRSLVPKESLQKLKKALIISALSGILCFGTYKGVEHYNFEKLKKENYRQIEEKQSAQRSYKSTLEDFYTDDVMRIFVDLKSKGQGITQRDVAIANVELLSKKGVVYFDPTDQVVVLRPYLEFGKTQPQAYKVIKEAKEFEHLWHDNKIYEHTIDARYLLQENVPDLKVIKNKINKANNLIEKNNGQRVVGLERMSVDSKTPRYRLVLLNKLTGEKTYNF